MTKESYAQTNLEGEQMEDIDTFGEVLDDAEVKTALLAELVDKLRKRLVADWPRKLDG